MARAQYRIFVSSPGDMSPERQLVGDTVTRLNASLPGVSIEIYLSEQDLYFAHRGPQEGIPLTSDYDLVVCLFWKRIGTLLLPEKFDAPDGRKRTGTEFEFETAVEAARNQRTETGLPRPAVLVYRKTEAVLFNAERVDEQQLQYRALNAFFERWIRDVNGHYLGYANSFETTRQFAEMFERHVGDWLALQRRGVTWDIGRKGSPFRGLDVFDEKHADVFFGRDACILAARARLNLAAANGFGALWIVGASGSGKSSLLRAGLLPSLKRSEGENLFRAVVLKPSELGAAAITGFAGRLLATLTELGNGSFRDAGSLARVCIESPASARTALGNALDAWSGTETRRRNLDGAPITRLIIAIDQAEELLTVRSAAERDQLVRLLLHLMEDSRLWLVLSFRSDFYAMLQHDARLLPLKQRASQLDLGAPTPAELASIISEPARAAGLTLQMNEEGSLATELAADTGSADSLPMLEFALQTLLEKALARGDRTLRVADYLAMGRAAGALSSAAEAALMKSSASAQSAFPRMLRELVDMNLQSKDSASTSRPFPLGRFDDDLPVLRLIDALSRPEARLLSLFNVDGKPHCRVVHESLFTRWPRARDQIRRDARRLDARRRLEEDLALWIDAAPKDKSLRLLHGLLLQEALDLKSHWKLEPSLTNFIDQSLAVERRRQRNRKLLSATFAIAALVAAGMAVYARSQQFRAEQSEMAGQQMLQQAALRAFGQMQDALLAGNLDVAHAHLAESLRYADTRRARLAAAYQLQRLPFAPYRTLPAAGTRRAAYSADGRKIVTVSLDTAEIWDAASGRRLSPALDHLGPFTTAQLVPGEELAVTIGLGRISLWNTQTGAEIGNGIRTIERSLLVRHQVSDDGRVALRSTPSSGDLELFEPRSDRPARTIASASRKGFLSALSRDGRVIATSPKAGQLLLLSTETLQPIARQPSLPAGAEIFCPRFTAKGNLLMYFGSGQIALWNRQHDTLALMDTAAPSCDRYSVSPDDSVLAAIGEQTVELWRTSDSFRFGNLVSQGRPISAEFSSDGLRLVVARADNVARQWLLNPLQEIGAPMRHRAGLSSAAYSPDGLTVLTTAEDGLARLWDVRSSEAPPLPLRHGSEVVSAEFSPDSRFVLTSTEHAVQVFSAADGKPMGAPIKPPSPLAFAKLSPDARLVVTAQDDESVRFWDFATRMPLDSMPLEGLTGATLSNDGKRLATSDGSGTIQLLSIPDLKPVATSRRLGNEAIPLKFAPHDDKLLIGDPGGAVILWNLHTGAQRTAAESGSELMQVEFSPDGERVLAIYDDMTLLLDAADARTLATVEESWQHARFNPAGNTLIAVYPDGKIAALDGRDASLRKARRLPGVPETEAIHDPGGTRLAIGTSAGLFLLDAESLNLLGPPLPNGDGITDGLKQIAFSPDGRRLLAVAENDGVFLWDVIAQFQTNALLLSRALTVLGGLEVSDDGRLEAVDNVRETEILAGDIAAPVDDELLRLIGWHFADRSERSISAFSAVPLVERIRADIDWAAPHITDGTTPELERSLTASYVAAPDHPLAILGLALAGLADQHQGREQAIRLSVERLTVSTDVDTICRGAELLRQLDEPVAALTVAARALSLQSGNDRATSIRDWASTQLAKKAPSAPTAATSPGSVTPTAATSAPEAPPAAAGR